MKPEELSKYKLYSVTVWKFSRDEFRNNSS